MWIAFSDGFVSVVKHRTAPNRLLVRARKREHLEAFLAPPAQIVETTEADYRFRATVRRDVFQRIMARRIDGIDYDNFKDSVKDPQLHDLYMGWWFDHRAMQEGRGLSAAMGERGLPRRGGGRTMKRISIAAAQALAAIPALAFDGLGYANCVTNLAIPWMGRDNAMYDRMDRYCAALDRERFERDDARRWRRDWR